MTREIAADAVLFPIVEAGPDLVLIERKGDANARRWTLAGGFVRVDEAESLAASGRNRENSFDQ